MTPVPVPPPKARLVACPACTQPSLYSIDNRWRPFCSPRCAGVDLGAWSSEGYRVGVTDQQDADATSEQGSPAH